MANLQYFAHQEIRTLCTQCLQVLFNACLKQLSMGAVHYGIVSARLSLLSSLLLLVPPSEDLREREMRREDVRMKEP